MGNRIITKTWVKFPKSLPWKELSKLDKEGGRRNEEMVPSTKQITLKKVHHTCTTYVMYLLHRDSAIPFQWPNHDDGDDDDDENRDEIMRS